jgi:hypothetical protein
MSAIPKHRVKTRPAAPNIHTYLAPTSASETACVRHWYRTAHISYLLRLPNAFEVLRIAQLFALVTAYNRHGT